MLLISSQGVETIFVQLISAAAGSVDRDVIITSSNDGQKYKSNTQAGFS